jgi:hypothetical protein
MNDVVSTGKLVATVKFLDASAAYAHKTYDYLVPSWMEGKVRPGDMAVVMVRSHKPGPKLVSVESVAMCAEGSHSATKSLAARVDLDGYHAEQNALMERRKLMLELELMEARRRQVEKFRDLAASDPEAAEKLRRLQELGGPPPREAGDGPEGVFEGNG